MRPDAYGAAQGPADQGQVEVGVEAVEGIVDPCQTVLSGPLQERQILCGASLGLKTPEGGLQQLHPGDNVCETTGDLFPALEIAPDHGHGQV